MRLRCWRNGHATSCTSLAISTSPKDAASGIDYNDEYLEHLDHAGGEHPDWDKVLKNRPSVLTYWHRQSPDYLVATDLLKSSLLTPGIVNLDHPPPILSGMVAVSLDPQGRLYRFDAVPPQKDTAGTSSLPYDWGTLFNVAGLDMTQFHSAEPMWNSLGASDQRAAWTGVWPGTSEPLRVEAASWRGKPVFFQLISDWTKPDRMPAADSSHSKAPEVLLVVFLLLLLAGAVWLARQNYVHQKSDTQGAFRLGFLIFVLQMLVWLTRGHFVPSLGTFGLFVLAASSSVFLGALFCVIYLALEPYVRRHWPHAIISWSRLMSGRIRDPLVGRDVLFGVILGISWSLIFAVLFVALKKIHATPQFGSTDVLLGARHDIGACLAQVTESVQATLEFFFLMFVFRVIFRKPWLAALVFVAFWTGIKAYDTHHLAFIVPAYAAVYGIAAFVILRFGFVALAAGIFTVQLLANVPFTTDFSSWYVGGSIFVVLLVAAMAVWGCYTALAGQKVFKEKLFE